MKTIQTLILLTGLSAGIPILAADQPAEAPPQEKLSAPKKTGAPAADQKAPEPGTPALPADTAQKGQPGEPASPPPASAQAAEPVSPAPVSPAAGTGGETGLRLNFRAVPLEMVLNYLSDAAGFIIVADTPVKGTVDVWSNQPLTKDEAVNLLNSVLNKNGYAAIRNGRTLTIVNKDEAKTKDIPVKSGSDPAGIPKTDEIVTQIIPVRFVEAAQLIKDLQPLVSPQTTMTANEAGNAIVITDTQANIRKVAEIIKAIDAGAEAETVVRVFHLDYADPVEMADLLAGLFPDDSRSGNSQAPLRFGGGPFGAFFGGGGRGGGGFGGGGPGGGFGGGGPGGGFGGGGRGGGGNSQNQRIRKRDRVIAVADQRTSSVIVSASKDLMEQIEGMVNQLDSNPAKKQKVFVYSLENADVQQVEQVLQDMFERNNNNTRNNRNSATQNNPLLNRSTQNQGRTSGTGNSGFGNSGTGNNRGGGGFGGQQFP